MPMQQSPLPSPRQAPGADKENVALSRRISELEEDRKGKADRVEELSKLCDFLGQARYEADLEHEKNLKEKEEELRKTKNTLRKAVETVRNHKSQSGQLQEQIKAIETDRNNCVEALNQLNRDLQEAHQEIARRGPPSPDAEAEGQVCGTSYTDCAPVCQAMVLRPVRTCGLADLSCKSRFLSPSHPGGVACLFVPGSALVMTYVRSRFCESFIDPAKSEL